jgi:hypothetical protein
MDNNLLSMLPDDSIASKLINESFKISTYTGFDSPSHLRSDFFSNNANMIYYSSLVDYSSLQKINACDYTKYDTFINQTFLYDMLVISKLYAIIYRLYYYHYNTTLAKNESEWDTFCKTAKINITNDSSSTAIISNIITINKLFDILNLKLSSDANASSGTEFNIANYNKFLYGTYGNTNMDNNIAASIISPLYHGNNDGLAIIPLKNFYKDEIEINKYYSIILGDYSTTIPYTARTPPCSEQTEINTFISKNSSLNILSAPENGIKYITRDNINSYYNYIISDESDNYLIHRAYIYLEAFNTIFNTDSNNILNALKYNMFYYNLIVYNVSIQYELVKTENERITLNSGSPIKGCYSPDLGKNINLPFITDFKFTNGECGYQQTGYYGNNKLYRETVATITEGNENNINTIETTINVLINNIKYMDKELNNVNNNEKIKSMIIKTTDDNKNYSKIFYENQEELNKVIYKYNEEYENFNYILFYYKLIIIFLILLIIIIVIIYFVNSINQKSKISIYSIIIILIIIAFIVYDQFVKIKEDFSVVIKKNYNENVDATIKTTTEIKSAIINKYKQNIDSFISNLLLSVENLKSNGNLNKSISYINNLSNIKNNKAEIYKIKKMNLINSIEIIKKTINFYYYIIIFIAFCIIILNIGLIIFLVNSDMIIHSVVLCAILFIILVYYISYNIQKSARLAENKNYWADYNPSSLNNFDDDNK